VQARDRIIVQNGAKGVRRQHTIFGHHDRLRFYGRADLNSSADLDWQREICEAFIAGAVGLGIPRNPDYNGASQPGVG
jgi:choline dehydrogenase-like flavoprotein